MAGGEVKTPEYQEDHVYISPGTEMPQDPRAQTQTLTFTHITQLRLRKLGSESFSINSSPNAPQTFREVIHKARNRWRDFSVASRIKTF
jgi:ribosome biogenesis SPOUT family RNA methylase Rps3